MKSLLYSILTLITVLLSNNLFASKLKESSVLNKEISCLGFLPLADIQKELMKEKNSKDISSMVLYVREGCPYCTKVIKFLKESDIKIVVKDASLPENKEYLLSKTHKTQVPCLFIEEKPMLESDDIIAYLRSALK